ncbi:F1-ATP synthase assembly protein [Amniculicola lignicola CBS 123094]|uniref:F1-ATP synthase assembly protein n=1 Tax=Amniculicola lignicola CBS 123094 TaxID=1392246 RepID=A0A6A5W5I3_9PLEO|nr:F1-ATP synthase assembly protein [Amniculicola lignicola CBS 123094]
MEALRPALASLRLPAARRAPRPLYRCLSTSTPRHAQPLPHPSVPGPPPDTPAPHASDALARVARKKKQAEMVKQAQEIRSGPKSYGVLKRRFWKDVTVRETDAAGLQVFLDSRPVRTPEKAVLTVPQSKHQLATAIALEWDLLVSAQQALKTHYIPLTSLTARALHIQAADAAGQTQVRDAIVKMCMRYLSTDTLLCWAPEKNIHDPKDVSSVRQEQIDIAQPIMAYLTTHVWPGVELRPILEPDSIMPVPQPEMTQNVVRGWVTGLPAFELAGLERAVLATKSLVVGVRFIHAWGEAFTPVREAAGVARFGIDEAADASSIEVRWQTQQWGEVDDTHDVEKEDLKRQLGSVIILIGGDAA